MPGTYDQIRIVQAGADIFVFDTIRWPEGLFKYPVVYTACALGTNSYETTQVGWKYITREQFEWILKHHSCIIEYLGADINQSNTFYCQNHKCWEHNGKDFWALGQETPEPEYYIEPDLDEERKI